MIDLFFDLTVAEDKISDASKTVRELDISRAKNERDLSQIDKRIHEVFEKIKDLPNEDIRLLTTKFQQLNLDHTTTSININEAIRKSEEKAQKIAELDKEREVQSGLDSKVARFQLRERLAQRAAEEMGKIFEEFSESSRKEIEKLTREEFYGFIPAAEALQVKITEDFHYDVRDRNDNLALQQFSMGQKQALSLAYITAISIVSEKYPPLVIDMPFSKLDKEVQGNIASRLPLLSKQVILLLLPGPEWNEITEKSLRQYASNIYDLQFDEKNRTTQIISV